MRSRLPIKPQEKPSAAYLQPTREDHPSPTDFGRWGYASGAGGERDWWVYQVTKGGIVPLESKTGVLIRFNSQAQALRRSRKLNAGIIEGNKQ